MMHWASDETAKVAIVKIELGNYIKIFGLWHDIC